MVKKKRQFPKTIILLTVFLFIIIGTILGFFIWWEEATRPVNPASAEERVFVVPKGYGVAAISQKLEDEGYIRNKLAFKIMAKKEGIASDLQAGDFYLDGSMNLFEIAQTLTHGTLDIWVTIPEGLRKEEVAEIFKKEYQERGEEFDDDVFLSEASKLEGYLFPDTYLMPKNAASSQVVEIMRNTFDQKVPDSKKLEAEKLGISFKQAIIFASLVEREAKYPKDREIVAGILLKRFDNDWPLQVDASIQYALGSEMCGKAKNKCDWWPKVTNTKAESPYNTYLHNDLPPAPICNPSLSSIEAVINHKKTGYWYYLSEPSGKMHYAETIEEHEENIKKYLTD